MTENKHITVKEAAKRLKVTPHYIRKLLRENKIVGAKNTETKLLEVDPSSLEAYKNTETYTNDLNELKQPMPITIKEAVEDIEDHFETDVISYVANIGAPLSGIVPDDWIILDDLLNSMTTERPGKEKKFEKITLFLHSGGGILESAIKFVEIIKHYADRFEVIVPMMAKSAATLISLSADTLYLTPLSELGPVDPVVQSPTNPNIQVPARAIDDLMKFYSNQQENSTTAEKSDIDKILLKKIEDIDVYLLGSYKSALAFSKQQLEKELNAKIKDKSKLAEAVNEFTEKYSSHSFPITIGMLKSYNLGTEIIDPAQLNAVKTLLAIYQGFMAGNNIVKTIGNRDMNRNVVIQTINEKQIPTRTAI